MEKERHSDEEPEDQDLLAQLDDAVAEGQKKLAARRKPGKKELIIRIKKSKDGQSPL